MDLTMPQFATEADEADWWYQNREQLGDLLVQASQNGQLGEGTLGRYQRRQRERAEAALEQQHAAGRSEPEEHIHATGR